VFGDFSWPAGGHTGCVPLARQLAILSSSALLAAGCGSAAKPTPAPVSAPASVAVLTAPSSATSAASTAGPHGLVPRFDHVVVVILENHAYGELVGQTGAPFLNQLETSAAVLTQSYAIGHPSEPNYLALFSGSTQGLSDDSCPHDYTGPNLAAALLARGLSFTGYSEDLPAPGFTGCSSGAYARKHNPWVNFSALPARSNQPMTAFPSDLADLPTVSFVIPNLDHDMHDGTLAQADQWLQAHLGNYASWSRAHHSLLIITTDEDDNSHNNQIATILTGAHVQPGQYDVHINHYGLLRTLLDSYQLTPFADAAHTPPLTTVWSR
jgi:phosphatidylinositol-3-phosphatase